MYSGREYRYRFAVYLYDYIGIGITIKHSISAEPEHNEYSDTFGYLNNSQ